MKRTWIQAFIVIALCLMSLSAHRREMNHPEGDTFEGLRPLCRELDEKGFRFEKLEDCGFG